MSWTLNPNDITLENLKSRAWRLQNLYKIKTKDRKTIPFKFNSIQQQIDSQLSQYMAILKARQFGISTYFLIKLLDRVALTNNRTAVILAHEQDSIKKLFRIVRFAYENMYPMLKPEMGGRGSMYELYFPERNSRIYCDLESRSDTITDLHVSEFAFVKDPDKVFATMDAVPLDSGNISIETTPQGLNHFYELWKDESWPFKRLFFPWFHHPDYQIPLDDGEVLALTPEESRLVGTHDLSPEQIKFRRFKIKQKNSTQKFMQEYPEDEESCFLMSGEIVIDRDKIAQLKAKKREPVKQKPFTIIHEPKRYGKYAIGADTAEGIGADYNSATVIDIQTLEEVAYFHSNNTSPKEFADILNAMGHYYSYKGAPQPLIGVERNNHGHAVLQWLTEHHKYSRVFKDTDSRFGFRTNSTSRPLIIDNLINAVDNLMLVAHNPQFFKELLTLVDNNGKIEAAQGQHDDTVMSMAIALEMVRAFNKTQRIFDLVKN